jgi:hypothetical protein
MAAKTPPKGSEKKKKGKSILEKRREKKLKKMREGFGGTGIGA